ncbi:hypothetical protein ACFJIX_24630 [Roseateles sp. UC29_93]|uniref:hypothetical protein n=1 Tax=Roseateles sp. UC29_93 TaxID=3350177 RepID=UPI00367326FB
MQTRGHRHRTLAHEAALVGQQVPQAPVGRQHVRHLRARRAAAHAGDQVAARLLGLEAQGRQAMESAAGAGVDLAPRGDARPHQLRAGFVDKAIEPIEAVHDAQVGLDAGFESGHARAEGSDASAEHQSGHAQAGAGARRQCGDRGDERGVLRR